MISDGVWYSGNGEKESGSDSTTTEMRKKFVTNTSRHHHGSSGMRIQFTCSQFARECTASACTQKKWSAQRSNVFVCLSQSVAGWKCDFNSVHKMGNEMILVFCLRVIFLSPIGSAKMSNDRVPQRAWGEGVLFVTNSFEVVSLFFGWIFLRWDITRTHRRRKKYVPVDYITVY